MARSPTVSRRSANLLLDHIAACVAVGQALPTEHRLAALGEGSRSAVRSSLRRAALSTGRKRRVSTP